MRRGPRLPLEELQPYLWEVNFPTGPTQAQAVPRTLDWAAVFGNSRPVEMEIGCGKGLFLVNAGRERPDVNFFGIDIERKYTLFTAARLARSGLHNVKVASCDARRFLGECVAAASVAAVHVYFPDPWWKNRHRKRRLFTQEFARQCVHVLQVGGHLQLVSDVAEYFAETAGMLEECEALTVLAAPEAGAPRHDLDYLTNFERKYRKEGRAIFRGVWQK
jgi:tRNA (guanine-N7-)-methyltransferase